MKIVLGLTAVSAIHLLLYPCQATGSNLPRVAQHSFSEPIHSPQYNSVQSIIEDCYNYLQSHECIGSRWRLDYHFYRPSLQKYSPHQWLWDSGAHMIVWSHRNVSNSIADLRTMLQLQPPDGFIPEMIFWGLEDMPWWKRCVTQQAVWPVCSLHCHQQHLCKALCPFVLSACVVGMPAFAAAAAGCGAWGGAKGGAGVCKLDSGQAPAPPNAGMGKRLWGGSYTVNIIKVSTNALTLSIHAAPQAA